MSIETKISSDPSAVARQFANDFAAWVEQASGDFHVALSGGSTPQLLFSIWAGDDSPSTDWSKVHFYWGDERCVPPTDAESNFGVTNELFFSRVGISQSNIHRVLGESASDSEAIRYAKCISDSVPVVNGLPKFDLVILGMGGDGHTASIFPHQMELMSDSRVCAVATHPESGQKRITLTGPVISNAARISFLINGSSKVEKFRGIVAGSEESSQWPATTFFQLDQTVIYADEAATGGK